MTTRSSAMELPSNNTSSNHTKNISNNNASSSTTMSKQEFIEKIDAFFSKNKITYIDATAKNCCSMHCKAQLYNAQESAQELYESFTHFSIPFSLLDPLLDTITQDIREIVIICTEGSEYIIEKELSHQIPNTTCNFSDPQLIEKGINLAVKEKARAINLEKIKQRWLTLLTDGKEFTNMKMDQNSCTFIFKDGTQKIFTSNSTVPALHYPAQKKEIIGYVGSRNGEPAHMVFKDGTVEYGSFSNNSGLRMMQRKREPSCNCCNKTIVPFESDVIKFCKDHTYCEGCFYSLFDIIADCSKCRKFEVENDPQRIPVTTTVTFASKLSKEEDVSRVQAATTSSSFLKTQKIDTSLSTQYAKPLPRGILKKVIRRIEGNCVFCSDPLTDLGEPITFCSEHRYCENCFPQALFEIIKPCPKCIKHTAEYSEKRFPDLTEQDIEDFNKLIEKESKLE